MCGHPVPQGWRIWRRDRGGTPSPNAGHPMAMMAGLLEVRLTKGDLYALGDGLRPLSPERINAAWRIVFISGLFATAITMALLGGTRVWIC